MGMAEAEGAWDGRGLLGTWGSETREGKRPFACVNPDSTWLDLNYPVKWVQFAPFLPLSFLFPKPILETRILRCGIE